MLEPLPDRYRAVVFDMDGLLLDTENLWHEAETELFRQHGQTFTFEDKLAVMGTSFEHTADYFADRLGRPAGEGQALVDRVYEIMDGMLRLPMALASNSSRQLVSTALATAGLTDAFDAIITADDVVAAKPAPDVYLLACERLGVAPEDSLALEDSPSGIAAAKAAGLACIAVPQFAETDVSAADRVIDSLEELLAET